MESKQEYGGVSRSWTVDRYTNYFEESADGKSKVFFRTSREELADGSVQKVSDQEFNHLQGDGRWDLTRKHVVKTYKKEQGVLKLVSYRVNGEERPHYWETTEAQIDEKTFVWTQFHTNPSVYNYEWNGHSHEVSRVTETCVYKTR